MVIMAPTLGGTNFLALGRILGTFVGAGAAVTLWVCVPSVSTRLEAHLRRADRLSGELGHASNHGRAVLGPLLLRCRHTRTSLSRPVRSRKLTTLLASRNTDLALASCS